MVNKVCAFLNFSRLSRGIHIILIRFTIFSKRYR